MNTKPWLVPGFLILVLGSCSAPEIKPVDIYPEDMCAFCKMAFSDQRFAAEIVTHQSEVFKFDDIGCMDHFLTRTPQPSVIAVFYKDFDTRLWLSANRATVVNTDIPTPMGSGKVAFGDAGRAGEFQREHPAPYTEE